MSDFILVENSNTLSKSELVYKDDESMVFANDVSHYGFDKKFGLATEIPADESINEATSNKKDTKVFSQTKKDIDNDYVEIKEFNKEGELLSVKVINKENQNKIETLSHLINKK